MSRVPHYLSSLKGDRWPGVVVWLDVEAKREYDKQGAERHRFLLGQYQYRLSPTECGGSPIQTSPQAMWYGIQALTKQDTTVRVFSHNLVYDLSVSEAVPILTALGWEVSRFAIDTDRFAASWLILKQARCTLVLSDTLNWWNTSIDQLAQDIGFTRPPLPASSDDIKGMERRVCSDVAVLRCAWEHTEKWLHESGAGSLMLTSSGQAMSHYRRNYLPERSVYVHDCEPALEMEREASWTGRCEAYRWGVYDGTVYEWDYELSYPRIARDYSVPVKLLGPLSEYASSWIGSELGLGPSSAAQELGPGTLLRVEVRSDGSEGAYGPIPARINTQGLDGVGWPLGSFETALWAPELQLIPEGWRFRILDGYVYELQPVLADWAQWIGDTVTGHPDPVVRRVAKGWAHSLIGRFGLRYPVWEEYALALEDDPGVQAVNLWDEDTEAEGGYLSKLLWMGGRVWEAKDVTDADSSVPAITSYITAMARVRLYQTLQWLGDRVLYCDTDSVMVTQDGHDLLSVKDVATAYPFLEGIRVKGVYDGANFIGPRTIILGDELRAAGIPKGSKRLKEAPGLVYEGQVWDRQADGVRVRRRKFHVGSMPDGRRVHLPGGATEPIRVGV